MKSLFFSNSRNQWESTKQQNGRKEGIEIRGQLILIHNYVESWPFKFVLKLITETLSFLAIYVQYVHKNIHKEIYIHIQTHDTNAIRTTTMRARIYIDRCF